MTAASELEIQGNLQTFPPAEIICEIRQARINGSLRLSRGEQKVIVYFRGGEVIFAVSNARASRLFEILLRENRIEKRTVAECSDFANDQLFSDFLVRKGAFPRHAIEALFKTQIENILREIVAWETGEWFFSPLVRLRENVGYAIKTGEILAEFARRTEFEIVRQKFADLAISFAAAPSDQLPQLQLSSSEAFVFSRFASSALTVGESTQLSVLPENVTLTAVYALWLGGLLVRQNWHAAFSAAKIEAILAAKVSLVKEIAKPPVVKTEPIAETVEETEAETEIEPAEAELTLENYLERVEKAENYYEILNVDTKIPLAEIKTNYFALAKRFHPDHFYKDTDTTVLRRVQESFTRLAQAYETLKSKDSRETYDFKIRKELAQKEKIRETSAEAVKTELQSDQALESFEKGFECLMNENYQEAVPLLARAVHYAPDIARYHAYYGKSLSVAEKYRHKAENELQTAIKLDAQNPAFRIMLVEFFIQYNLLKRAEGELNRLLTTFPDNKEAHQLLDSLNKK